MLIGITGDTHGDELAIRTLAKINLPLDMWMHTGDFFSDGIYLGKLARLPTKVVYGNNDFARGNDDYENIFTLCGKKIYLTHGHKYLAKGSGALIARAQELAADVLIYGHTHMPKLSEENGLLVINPGSPSYPRGGSHKSFVLMKLEDGKKIEAKIEDVLNLGYSQTI